VSRRTSKKSQKKTSTDAAGQPVVEPDEELRVPRAPPTHGRLAEANARLEAQYRLVDTGRLTTIVIAQHADPALQNMINYLSKKEVPANFDVAQVRKLKRDALRYSLIDTTEPAGLYYIGQPARVEAMAIRLMIPRLVIPTAYQPTLLEMYHDSPFGGHLGALRTYHKLAIHYYWDSLFESCRLHVHNCRACRDMKQRLKDPKQLAGQMPTPTEPFEVISMDTCGPFEPSAGGFKYVFTFIDHFTRYAIAVPSFSKLSAAFAQIFINEIIAKYGPPRVLISDNGGEFVSGALNEVYKTMKVQRIVSAQYHPQSNGLVERLNGTMKQIVNSLTVANPADWAYMLPLAMHAYNTSVGDLLDMTPYELVYGRPPRTVLNDLNEILGSAGDAPRSEYVRMMKHQFQQAYYWVKAVLDADRQRVAKENIELGDHIVYHVGDIVYCRNFHTDKKVDPRKKWDTDKAYVVIGRKGPSSYTLHEYSLATKSKVGKQTTVRNAMDIAYLPQISKSDGGTFEAAKVGGPSLDEMPGLETGIPLPPPPDVTPVEGTPKLPATRSPRRKVRAPSDASSVGHRVHSSRLGQMRIDYDESSKANDIPALDYTALHSLPKRQAAASLERKRRTAKAKTTTDTTTAV
jgi:transposase InsO family protein